MSIRTKILVWVEPAGNPVEVGIFDLVAAPGPDDLVTVPSHPTMRVTWRKFAPNETSGDGAQLLLACSYYTPVASAAGGPSAMDQMEDQQTRINKKLRENQKIIGEIQGRAFKDATAYTNVIIIAGYAAIFTIWSNTKAILTPIESSCVAGLVLFSFMMFVVFELSKMITTSIVMRRNAAVAMRDPMAEDYLAQLVEAEGAGIRKMGAFMKLWPLFLFATIIPAIAAAAFLFWKFYTVISPATA